jgi:hypothetical protein
MLSVISYALLEHTSFTCQMDGLKEIHVNTSSTRVLPYLILARVGASQQSIFMESSLTLKNKHHNFISIEISILRKVYY